jgi:hypothetical protein
VLDIPTATIILTGALFLAADAPKAWSWGVDGPTATLIAAFIAIVPTLLVGIATLILSARIARVSADLSRVSSGIASQQLETAKNKLRLDLFERRYAAFEAALKLASIAVTKGDIPNEARREFVVATRGVQFLFDQEIQDYCDKLAKEAVSVRVGEQMLDSSLPVGDQRTQTAKAWEEQMKWFTEQMAEIPKRFGPFLKIRG